MFNIAILQSIQYLDVSTPASSSVEDKLHVRRFNQSLEGLKLQCHHFSLTSFIFNIYQDMCFIFLLLRIQYWSKGGRVTNHFACSRQDLSNGVSLASIGDLSQK